MFLNAAAAFGENEVAGGAAPPGGGVLPAAVAPGVAVAPAAVEKKRGIIEKGCGTVRRGIVNR